jgi:hypothetical protein
MTTQPAWLRNGLTYGAAAAVVTLVVNVGARVARGSDLCHPGAAGSLPYLGFALFVIVAALAGRATVKAGQPKSAAALTGLVVGAVSGIAGVILLWLALGDVHQMVQCAQAQTSAPVPSVDVFRTVAIIASLIAIAAGVGIGAAAGVIGGLTAGVREQTSG